MSEVALPEGVTMRDWFAAHCPDSEVDARMPRTIGDLADRFVKLGWVSLYARKMDAPTCYTKDHVQRLRALVRYEYADAMIAARRGAQPQ
jgi:hypothetical protein